MNRYSSSIEAEESSDIEKERQLDPENGDDLKEKYGEEKLRQECDIAQIVAPGDGGMGEYAEDELAEEPSGVVAVLSRVLSRTSAKSCHPGPPPDGGLRAWVTGMCNAMQSASVIC